MFYRYLVDHTKPYPFLVEKVRFVMRWFFFPVSFSLLIVILLFLHPSWAGADTGKFRLAGMQVSCGGWKTDQNQYGVRMQMHIAAMKSGLVQSASKRFQMEIGGMGETPHKNAAECWALYE